MNDTNESPNIKNLDRPMLTGEELMRKFDPRYKIHDLEKEITRLKAENAELRKDNDTDVSWHKDRYDRLFDDINNHDPDWLSDYLEKEDDGGAL